MTYNSDHTHTINTGFTPSTPIWTIPNSNHTHSITVNDPLPNMETYRQKIETAIYEQRILTNQLTKQAQEKPMSTLDKIKQERREKREREELEAKFEAWETHLGNAGERDVIFFTADLSGKTYAYAGIFTDKRWFLTGQITCGMATEEFIAWLIDRDVDVHDLMFMDAPQ